MPRRAPTRNCKESTMTYLVADDLPDEPAGERFRALLARPASCELPGAHNGHGGAAGQGRRLRGALSVGRGDDRLDGPARPRHHHRRRRLASSSARSRGPSGLPVLVDGDTGYGEALNVMHMVRAFEDAGAGAVQIEDQLLPKKCGHLNDKKLADAARHGGQGRRRRQGPPASLSSSPAPTRRPAKGSTARSPAPSSMSRPAPTRSSPRR